jgi:hypothetical protein
MSIKSKLKIAVLDDSQFYLALLTEELSQFAGTLSNSLGFRPEVVPYLTPDDFLESLDNETDLAFIDYYLGDGKTAADIIEKIKDVAPDCEIVIISKTRNLNSIQPLWQGAKHFVYKDGGSLIQSCLLLKDFVQKRFDA